MCAIVALCVAAAVPGTFVTSQIGFSDHYREAIAAVGFLGLLTFCLWRNRHLRAANVTVSWTRLWLAGLLAVGGASALWAADLGFFFSKYLLWLAAAAALLVTLSARLDLPAMLQLARGLTLVAAYIAVIGLIQVMFDVDIFLQTHSPSANYHNKNAAMQVIVLVFPMIVFALLYERRRKWSVWYWPVLALALAHVFHTQTRSAWLALALEIIVIAGAFLWLRRPLKSAVADGEGDGEGDGDGKGDGLVNWNHAHKIAAVVSLLLFIALVNISAHGLGGAGQSFTSAVSQLQRDAGSYARARPAERYRIWSDTMQMVAKNPALGSGMGSFSHNLLTDSDEYETFAPLRAHNDVLETGVELGAAGVLLLAAAALGLLAVLWTLIRRGELHARVFYLLIAAALAGSALQMQFSFPYQMPLPLILFGVYAGLILKRGGGRSKTLTLRARHWSAGMAATGAACALALMLNLSWLNTVFAAEANARAFVWRNPIHAAPLLGRPLCHRGIVQLFVRLASAFQAHDRYPESLGVADSIGRCVADSWVAWQVVVVGLYKQEKWDETIALLKRARRQAPIGNYRDTVNLIATYTETGAHAEAVKVFRELLAEPEELLVKRSKTLRSIVLFALQIHDAAAAQKFYRLLRLNHSGSRRFAAEIAPLAQRLPDAEGFMAWLDELEAEMDARKRKRR